MVKYQFRLTETLSDQYAGHESEHVVLELGTYDTFGQMMLLAQKWFKSKGAYRSERPKGEPPAKDHAWDQGGYEVYYPKEILGLNLYRIEDFSQYTFERFRVAYLDHINSRTKFSVDPTLKWGVLVASVYQNKKDFKCYSLYVRMEIKHER